MHTREGSSSTSSCDMRREAGTPEADGFDTGRLIEYGHQRVATSKIIRIPKVINTSVYDIVKSSETSSSASALSLERVAVTPLVEVSRAETICRPQFYI